MSNQRESEILKAMSAATIPEQKDLLVELNSIRAVASAAAAADREIDLGQATVNSHLSTIAGHGRATASSDWLSEVEAPGNSAEATRDMAVQAALWMSRTSAEVKADSQELQIQAEGMAHVAASAYENIPAATAAFMTEFARLATKEGLGAVATKKVASMPDGFVIGLARADAICTVTGDSIPKGMECYVRPVGHSDLEVVSRAGWFYQLEDAKWDAQQEGVHGSKQAGSSDPKVDLEQSGETGTTLQDVTVQNSPESLVEKDEFFGEASVAAKTAYQDWTNWDTFAVGNAVDNDEGMHLRALEIARSMDYSDAGRAITDMYEGSETAKYEADEFDRGLVNYSEIGRHFDDSDKEISSYASKSASINWHAHGERVGKSDALNGMTASAAEPLSAENVLSVFGSFVNATEAAMEQFEGGYFAGLNASKKTAAVSISWGTIESETDPSTGFTYDFLAGKINVTGDENLRQGLEVHIRNALGWEWTIQDVGSGSYPRVVAGSDASSLDDAKRQAEVAVQLYEKNINHTVGSKVVANGDGLDMAAPKVDTHTVADPGQEPDPAPLDDLTSNASKLAAFRSTIASNR